MTKDNPNQGLMTSVRAIDSGNCVQEFDCGDQDLNDFIIHESWPYLKARLSVTYIYESVIGKVDAFISLANDRVSMSDFENKSDFNRFRKKDFLMQKELKAILLLKYVVLVCPQV